MEVVKMSSGMKTENALHDKKWSCAPLRMLF